MARRPGSSRPAAPLRRALGLPVWGDLTLRLAAATLLVFIVVMIHWFDRNGLVDHADGHVSFLDVVYFTMISITTTGFGDIVPVAPLARSLANLESVIGQLFPATLLARLVALHLAHEDRG